MKTIRNSAIIGGLAILIMAVVAAFSYGYVHNSLIITGNPEATIHNIIASISLFKVEIFGWMLILLCDVIVAWALYIFFINDNREISLLAAGLRTIYSAILGFAIVNLIQIQNMLDKSTIANSEIINQKVMVYLESFENTWSFGLIIFGFHLLLTGYLVLKSGYIHHFWGILLLFAAVSYVGIHSSKIIFPEFESQIETAEMLLSLPMALSEIGFAIWLIIRGGKPRTVFRRLLDGESKNANS